MRDILICERRITANGITIIIAVYVSPLIVGVHIWLVQRTPTATATKIMTKRFVQFVKRRLPRLAPEVLVTVVSLKVLL